jgi:ADP-glucose pyrophosphorylase
MKENEDFGWLVVEQLVELTNFIIGGGRTNTDRWATPPAIGVEAEGTIGRGCFIEGSIIDKNARIGDGVAITPEGKPANMDRENYFIRDGVVVIPKGAVIEAGSRI